MKKLKLIVTIKCLFYFFTSCFRKKRNIIVINIFNFFTCFEILNYLKKNGLIFDYFYFAFWCILDKEISNNDDDDEDKPLTESRAEEVVHLDKADSRLGATSVNIDRGSSDSGELVRNNSGRSRSSSTKISDYNQFNNHNSTNNNINNDSNETLSLSSTNVGHQRRPFVIDTDDLINLSFLNRSTSLNNRVVKSSSRHNTDNDNDKINDLEDDIEDSTSNTPISSLNNLLAQMNSEDFNLIPDAKQLQMAVLGNKKIQIFILFLDELLFLLFNKRQLEHQKCKSQLVWCRESFTSSARNAQKRTATTTTATNLIIIDQNISITSSNSIDIECGQWSGRRRIAATKCYCGWQTDRLNSAGARRSNKPFVVCDGRQDPQSIGQHVVA